MPPETPRVSTGAWRSVLWFVAGLLIGVVAAVPALIFFLRSDAGAGIMAAYLTVSPPLPNVTVDQSSGTVVVPQLVSGAAGIPVPKASATPEYAAALNATVRDIVVIAASSTELSAVLTRINNQALTHTYDGLIDLVVDAKARIAAQGLRVSQFGADLTALSSASQKVPDAVTKTTTLDLVAKGQALQASLQTYTQSLDALLSGAMPTQQQVDGIKSQSATLEAHASDFVAVIQSLERHFGVPQK
jgi:hypothetical protein